MAEPTSAEIEAYATAHATPYEQWMADLHDEAARELPYPSMLSGPVVGATSPVSAACRSCTNSCGLSAAFMAMGPIAWMAHMII